ncbi:MAG: TrkA family potassium uptake protein [Malacoplasma sp.]|nr:TrkA family potassium uptake protein [Malacoplasma sp.]
MKKKYREFIGKKTDFDNDRLVKKYLIIGYGKFGKGFSERLLKEGVKENKIFIVDRDDNVLKSAANQFTNVINASITDFDSINAFNIDEISTIVIAMSNLEESLMIASNCIKYSDKRYYAKAKNEVHSKLLKTLGVDEVVVPEQEVGNRLAYKSLFRNDVEINSINPNLNIIQIKLLNEEIIGKSIKDANLRQKYNCNIFSLNRENKFIFPDPETILERNDTIVVVCKKEDSQNIINLLS